MGSRHFCKINRRDGMAGTFSTQSPTKVTSVWTVLVVAARAPSLSPACLKGPLYEAAWTPFTSPLRPLLPSVEFPASTHFQRKAGSVTWSGSTLENNIRHWLTISSLFSLWAKVPAAHSQEAAEDPLTAEGRGEQGSWLTLGLRLSRTVTPGRKPPPRAPP